MTRSLAALQAPALAGALALSLALAGCKSPATVAPEPNDASLANSVHNALASDGALGNQPIQASVQNGVASLNGTVPNDAARSLAGKDAASVAGVRTVLNNLIVASGSMSGPVSADVTAPPPQQVRTVIVRKPSPMIERNSGSSQRSNSSNNQNSNQYPQSANNNQPPPQQQPQQTAPAQPAFRDVTIPAGSTIPIRITQTLDSASTQQGQAFSGSVATDILIDGLVTIPQGSGVSGRVDAVHDAGHFSGNSLLTLSLTDITRRGQRLGIATEPFTKEGNGRGKNTAEKIGGGAAVGAILGGIFGGGKGAAIGAAAGGATGAGVNAATRGQQVQIPSETVIRFRLTNPLTLRVATRNDGNANYGNRNQNSNQASPDPNVNSPSNDNNPPAYGNRNGNQPDGPPVLQRRTPPPQ